MPRFGVGFGVDQLVGGPPPNAPTVSSIVVSANGTTITVNLSENCNVSSGAGWTLVDGSNNYTLTYVSGSGSTALVFASSGTINYGETVTANYSASTGNVVASGTGRAPLATFSGQQVTNGSTQPFVQSITAPGSTYFTCPITGTWTVNAVGGGGGGGGGTASLGGGGGGGGEQRVGVGIALSSGSMYLCVVGAGGAAGFGGSVTEFVNSSTVYANGGMAGATATGGAGGTGGTGGTGRSGGTGGTGLSGGGGGGGSGGTAAGGNGGGNGGVPTGGAGGTAVTGGGSGGAGGNALVAGNQGTAPGGGAGGGGLNSAGAAGQPGSITLTGPT